MAGKNGGARPGAGRKPTGAKTKCYTITLPLEEAEALEKRAAQLNKTVNKYLRDIIEASGQYLNVNVDDSSAVRKGRYVDEVISEKSYTVIENGHEVHKTETHIRRWEPEEDLELAVAEGETSPYKVD